MKKWKQHITMVLMLTILITLIPVGNVQAKSKSLAKLEAKDFIYTYGGKKTDFLKLSKNSEGYHFFTFDIIDKKNRKGDGKTFKTSRKVKIGSTESYVKKQYGNAAKVKVKKKETYYKYIKYTYYDTDISAWKTYLDYNLKKGNDKYKIRFYLDKKNKVTAIVYIKNLNKFYNYPNKELNPGLTFQAPNGKKVTTKTINGKKVYMIPRGTKIKFKKGSMTKTEFNKVDYYISMYDVYGKQMGYYDRDWFFDSTGHAVIQGKSYDFETIMNMGGMYYSNGKEMNIKQLEKYLYFTLRCDDTWSDGQNIKRNKAPAVYYFKFK